MKITECALNESEDNDKICVPKKEMKKYLLETNKPIEDNIEKEFIKDVCGTKKCDNHELMETMSSSNIARLQYIKDIAYKPDWPKSADTHWPLSNTEIDTIQKQFMYRKPDYYALKTWYVDFMKTLPNIYINFDYKSFVKNPEKRYVGFIYNTDHFPNPGIHWISVLIDTKNKTFETIDSLGFKPQPEIMEYYKYVTTQIPGLEFKRNTKKHQDSSSDECGVYALYFIWLRLLNKTMDEINEGIVSSKYMRLFRKIFFWK